MEQTQSTSQAVEAALDLVYEGCPIPEAVDRAIKAGLATQAQRLNLLHIVHVEMGR